MTRIKGIYKHSEETKRKIELANSIALKNRTIPIETRIKISLSIKGKKKPIRTEEHKRNISIANKGKIAWNKGLTNIYSEKTKEKMIAVHKGKKLSEEHRNKISLGNKGRIVSKETREKISKSNKIKNELGLKKSMKGIKTWNYGLTKETDNRLKRLPMKEETKEKLRRAVLLNYIKHPEIKEKIKQKLKELPISFESNCERTLQNKLIENNINFIKHKYINILHGYKCDIFIEPNIIVEVDGLYWHNYPIGNYLDFIRNIELKNANYKVLRFWEHQINNNIIECLEEIKNER